MRVPIQNRTAVGRDAGAGGGLNALMFQATARAAASPRAAIGHVRSGEALVKY
jgi:hypothetical protein